MMKAFYIIDDGKVYLISAKTAQQALDYVKQIKRKSLVIPK